MTEKNYEAVAESARVSIHPKSTNNLPKYHEFYHRITSILSDSQAWSRRELSSQVADRYLLNHDVLTASDVPKIKSRIGTAIEQLQYNGLIEKSPPAGLRLTKFGMALCSRYPNVEGSDILELPEFIASRNDLRALYLINDADNSVIPEFPFLMLPVLNALSDGGDKHFKAIVQHIVESLNMSPTQISKKSGNPKLTLLEARLTWSLDELYREMKSIMWIDEKSKPWHDGTYRILDHGKVLIKDYVNGFSDDLVRLKVEARLEAPIAAILNSGVHMSDKEALPSVDNTKIDPIHQIESAINSINSDVAAQLIKLMHERHPDFFEHAVMKLLLEMGYAGANGDGKRIGGSGDGGVDGVINQDRFGLDQIYVQAKRYAPDNTVGREAIQAFVGALTWKGASRGVFITTSKFSKGAIEYAKQVKERIILIDGKHLADLMIEYNVGIQTKKIHSVIGVDMDFFE